VLQKQVSVAGSNGNESVTAGARTKVAVRRNAPVVLVVDDYSDAREMYGEYLRFAGFEVLEAATGVEAVERAIERRPDIILMDLSLPVMDGCEATRRLKADGRTSRIPVVALTGHALAGYSDRARKAGCDAFLAKPCLPEDLVVEINRMLADPPTTWHS
jgi:two-component system, cell cycle response regulator DivK